MQLIGFSSVRVVPRANNSLKWGALMGQLGVMLLGAVGCAHLGSGRVEPPTCSLFPSGGKWGGSCGKLIEGDRTVLSLTPATAITSGIWRRGKIPSIVWAGTITVGSDPTEAVEIEVYDDGRGAIRTLYGWFAVSHFTVTKDELRFNVDASREVLPSEIDREIVERADQILSSEAVWNRTDNRQCDRKATTWSIFCAMEKATTEVAGAFHHRRPALEIVRTIVDERSAGRQYHHRLMDYNNDPTTHLDDVRSLFAEALRRIGAVAEP